jgi:hypothetical protein
LLLAEHIALSTLREGGVAAASTKIVDRQGQRFLEVERFDRIGTLGRKAAISLAALDAEFVGKANQPWPVITRGLAKQGVITPRAAEVSEVLWAFGALIGNTDMHNGNLSFVSEHGRPYEMAPAYDMTPMTFAPTSGGRLPHEIQPITPHFSVSHAHWRRAEQLAMTYLAAIQAEDQFTAEFQVCVEALSVHLERTRAKISRLA